MYQLSRIFFVGPFAPTAKCYSGREVKTRDMQSGTFLADISAKISKNLESRRI